MSEESNRITLQEYLNALQVVEHYHKQLMDESKIIKRRLMGLSITDFLRSDTNTGIRVEHILIEYRSSFGDCDIDDVIKGNFLKIRNAGGKSWSEFVTAREKLLDELQKDSDI
jgi:hypothetical protein